MLATAIWRNIFKADEEVDMRNLGLVVSYLRGILNGLEGIEDEGIAAGDVVFGDLGSERDGVLAMSRGMKAPFAGDVGVVGGDNGGIKRGGGEIKRTKP